MSGTEQDSRNGLEQEVQAKVVRSEWDGVLLFLGFCCRSWCSGLREHAGLVDSRLAFMGQEERGLHSVSKGDMW